MKNSPLQLEHYYLTAVHIDCDESVQVKSQIVWQVESLVTLAGHKEDARRWKVALTVKFKPAAGDPKPYDGSISFTGFFAVDPSYPEPKVKFLVETNGPSVLFGAVREMCANLTARGPWPTVMLPTQSFYNPPAPAKTAEKKIESAGDSDVASESKTVKQ
jgi:preprotein translocase subunit SecB